MIEGRLAELVEGITRLARTLNDGAVIAVGALVVIAACQFFRLWRGR